MEQEELCIVTEQNVYGDIHELNDPSKRKQTAEDMDALIESAVAANRELIK